MLKRNPFKTQILKLEASIDIRLLHFSHETFHIQFLIGRTRGEGGQVAFGHETFHIQFLIGRTRGEGGQVAFSRTSPK